MLKAIRGKITRFYEINQYKIDHPEMGGRGEHADLHPPMWNGGT
jgi:hypothetical protein